MLAALAACGRVGFDIAATADGSPPTDAARDAGNGDASRVTSCSTGLSAICGAAGAGDCCESPLVTGGAYARSFDVATDGMFASNAFTATVGDFRLDKYEITVGRFRAFIAAGMGTQAQPPVAGTGAHAATSGSGWDPAWTTNLLADTNALIAAVKCNSTAQTWTDAPAGNENRPMNCITWWEAMAFCVWDGGYLPTETEWDYAAAGGAEQRAFPWSTPPGFLEIDPTRGSYSDGTNCVGDGLPGCAITDLIPVGSKPQGDGRWGQSDLGGNLWEWTLDAYRTPYSIVPCTDCADLAASGGRASRGGYYSSPIVWLRSANRFGNAEAFRVSEQGARCARAP